MGYLQNELGKGNTVDKTDNSDLIKAGQANEYWQAPIHGDFGNLTTQQLPKEQYQELLDRTNQTVGDKVALAAGNLIPNIGLGILEQVGYLGDLPSVLNTFTGKGDDYSNWLSDYVKTKKDPLGKVQSNSIYDTGWWVQNGTGLIESIGEFAAIGFGMGAAFNLAGKGAGLLADASLTAANANRVKKTANFLGQVGTSFGLSYAEGAMTGADVYKKVYNDLVQKINPDTGKEYSEQERKEKAANAAANTTRINTALVGMLNMTSVAPLFKTFTKEAEYAKLGLTRNSGEKMVDFVTRMETMIPGIGQQIKDKANKQMYKTLGIEAAQESIEENINLAAQNIGEEGHTKFDIGEVLDKVAHNFTTVEGGITMMFGALGGIGQTSMMHYVPSPLTKTPEYDSNGEIKKDANGKIIYKNWTNDSTRQQVNEAAKFTRYVNTLKKDINTIYSLQDDLKKAVKENNPEKVHQIKNQLFDLRNYQSITNGASDNLIQTLQEVHDVDNTKDLGDDYKAAIDEESKQEIPDNNKIEDLTKKYQEVVGKTQAMQNGLAESKEDIAYKTIAQDKINKVKKLTNDYKSYKTKYGYDEESMMYVDAMFKLHVEAEHHKDNINYLQEKLLIEESKVRTNRELRKISIFESQYKDRSNQIKGIEKQLSERKLAIDTVKELFDEDSQYAAELGVDTKEQAVEKLNKLYDDLAKEKTKLKDKLDNDIKTYSETQPNDNRTPEQIIKDVDDILDANEADDLKIQDLYNQKKHSEINAANTQVALSTITTTKGKGKFMSALKQQFQALTDKEHNGFKDEVNRIVDNTIIKEGEGKVLFVLNHIKTMVNQKYQQDFLDERIKHFTDKAKEQQESQEVKQEVQVTEDENLKPVNEVLDTKPIEVVNENIKPVEVVSEKIKFTNDKILEIEKQRQEDLERIKNHTLEKGDAADWLANNKQAIEELNHKLNFYIQQLSNGIKADDSMSPFGVTKATAEIYNKKIEELKEKIKEIVTTWKKIQETKTNEINDKYDKLVALEEEIALEESHAFKPEITLPQGSASAFIQLGIGQGLNLVVKTNDAGERFYPGDEYVSGHKNEMTGEEFSDEVNNAVTYAIFHSELKENTEIELVVKPNLGTDYKSQLIVMKWNELEFPFYINDLNTLEKQKKVVDLLLASQTNHIWNSIVEGNSIIINNIKYDDIDVKTFIKFKSELVTKESNKEVVRNMKYEQNFLKDVFLNNYENTKAIREYFRDNDVKSAKTFITKFSIGSYINTEDKLRGVKEVFNLQSREAELWTVEYSDSLNEGEENNIDESQRTLKQLDGNQSNRFVKTTSNYTNADGSYTKGRVYTFSTLSGEKIPIPLFTSAISEEELGFTINSFAEYFNALAKNDGVKLRQIQRNVGNIITVNKTFEFKKLGTQLVFHSNGINGMTAIKGGYIKYMMSLNENGEIEYTEQRLNKKGEVLNDLADSRPYFTESLEDANSNQSYTKAKLYELFKNRYRNINFDNFKEGVEFINPITGKKEDYKQYLLNNDYLLTDCGILYDSDNNPISHFTLKGKVNTVIGFSSNLTQSVINEAEKKERNDKDIKAQISKYYDAINQRPDTLGKLQSLLGHEDYTTQQVFDNIYKVLDEKGVKLVYDKKIDHPAGYIPSKNQIFINITELTKALQNYNTVYGYDSPLALLQQIISHEAIHAILYNSVEDYENSELKKDLQSFKSDLVKYSKDLRYKNLFDDFKSKYPETYNNIFGKRKAADDTETDISEQEIVTYALTNRYFAELLNNIKSSGENATKGSKSESMWSKLKDIILDTIKKVLKITQLDRLNGILDKHIIDLKAKEDYVAPDNNIDEGIEGDEFSLLFAKETSPTEYTNQQPNGFSRFEKEEQVRTLSSYILNANNITWNKLKVDLENGSVKNKIIKSLEAITNDKKKAHPYYKSTSETQLTNLKSLIEILKDEEDTLGYWKDIETDLKDIFDVNLKEDDEIYKEGNDVDKVWEGTKVIETRFDNVSFRVKQAVKTLQVLNTTDRKNVYDKVTKNFIGVAYDYNRETSTGLPNIEPFLETFSFLSQNLRSFKTKELLLNKLEELANIEGRSSLIKLVDNLKSDEDLLNGFFSNMRQDMPDKTQLDIRTNISYDENNDVVKENTFKLKDLTTSFSPESRIKDDWFDIIREKRRHGEFSPSIEFYNVFADKITEDLKFKNIRGIANAISNYANVFGIELNVQAIENDIKDSDNEENELDSKVRTTYLNLLNGLAKDITENKDIKRYAELTNLAKTQVLYKKDVIENVSVNANGDLTSNYEKPTFFNQFIDTLNSEDEENVRLLTKSVEEWQSIPLMQHSNWLWSDRGIAKFNKDSGIKKMTELNKYRITSFGKEVISGIDDKINDISKSYSQFTNSYWNLLQLAQYAKDLAVNGGFVNIPIQTPSDASSTRFIKSPRFKLGVNDIVDGKIDRNSDLFQALRNTLIQEAQRILHYTDLIFEKDENGFVSTYTQKSKEELAKIEPYLSKGVHFQQSGEEYVYVKNGKPVGTAFQFHNMKLLVNGKEFTFDDYLKKNDITAGSYKPFRVGDFSLFDDFIDAFVAQQVSYAVNRYGNKGYETAFNNSKDFRANVKGYDTKFNYAGNGSYQHFLTEMALNYYISYVEQELFITNNLSAYKNYKDAAKRAKLPNSGGVAHAGINRNLRYVAVKDILVNSKTYKATAEGIAKNLVETKKNFYSQEDLAFDVNNIDISDKSQLSGLEKDVQAIMSGYLNINSADGTAWISPDFFLTHMKALGKGKDFDKLKTIIDKIYDSEKRVYKDEILTQDEVNSINDGLIRLQQEKPLGYSKQYVKAINDIKTVAFKCAFFITLPQIVKNTPLESVLNYMSKNGVDIFATESAIKLGLPLLYNVTDKTGNIVESQLDKLTVYDFDPRNLFYQQDIPDAIRDYEQSLSIQLNRNMLSDLKESITYYKGKNGSQLVKYAHKTLSQIITINSDNTVKELTKDEEVDKTKIADIVQRNTKSGSEIIKEIVEYDEATKDFKGDINDPSVSSKIQDVLYAIFTNQVTKIKFPGAHTVLMSNALLYSQKDKTSKEVFKNSNNNFVGIEYIDKVIERGNTKLQFSHVENNDGKKTITKSEILLPAWSKEFFTTNEIGENIRININDLPEEIRTMIGWRIPHEMKHSTIVMEVVGFLPEEAGSTIVLPDEVVAQMGSDFDIDSLYMIYKPFKKVKDKKTGQDVFKINKFLDNNNSTVEERFINWINNQTPKEIYDSVSDLISEERDNIDEYISSEIKSAQQMDWDDVQKENQTLYNETLEDIQKKLDGDNTAQKIDKLFSVGQQIFKTLPDDVKEIYWNDEAVLSVKGVEKIIHYKNLTEQLLDPEQYGWIGSHSNVPNILNKLIPIYDMELELLEVKKSYIKEIQEAYFTELKSRQKENIDKLKEFDFELWNSERNTLLKDFALYQANLKAEFAGLTNVDSFKDLDITEQNNLNALKSEYFDIIKSIALHPEHLQDLMTRSGFDMISEAAQEATKNLEQGKLNITTTMESQNDRRQENVASINMKGIATILQGVANVFNITKAYITPNYGVKIKHYIGSTTDRYTTKEKAFQENFGSSIVETGTDDNGKYHILSLHKFAHNDNGDSFNLSGRKILEVTAEPAIAFYDAVKTPIGNALNLNEFTFPAYFALKALGVPDFYAEKFVGQSIIRELAKNKIDNIKGIVDDGEYHLTKTKTTYQKQLIALLGDEVENDILSVSDKAELDKEKSKFDYALSNNKFIEFSDYRTLPTSYMAQQYLSNDINLPKGFGTNGLKYDSLSLKVYSLKDLEQLDIDTKDFNKLSKEKKIAYLKDQLIILETFTRDYIPLGERMNNWSKLISLDKAKVSKDTQLEINNSIEISKADDRESRQNNIFTNIEGEKQFLSDAIFNGNAYLPLKIWKELSLDRGIKTFGGLFYTDTKVYNDVFKDIFKTFEGKYKGKDLMSFKDKEAAKKKVHKHLTQTLLGNIDIFNDLLNNESEIQRIFGISANPIKPELDFEYYNGMSLPDKIKYVKQHMKDSISVRSLINYMKPQSTKYFYDNNGGFYEYDITRFAGNEVEKHLRADFDNMWKEDNVFIKSLLTDLIKHDYLRYGLNYTYKGIAKYISPDIKKELGIYDFNKGLNQEMQADVNTYLTNTDNLTTEFVKNNFKNDLFVKDSSFYEMNTKVTNASFGNGDIKVIGNEYVNTNELPAFYKEFKGNDEYNLYKKFVNNYLTFYYPIQPFTNSFFERGMSIYQEVQSEDYYKNLIETNTQVLILEIQNNPNNVFNDFINNSGGANGADTYWDVIGRQYGVTNHKHYREPGQNTIDSYELRRMKIHAVESSKEDYEEGMIKAKQATRDLGRRLSQQYAFYQYRNWLQVKYSDAIFAISTILEKGSLDKKGYTASSKQVEGGTGYAVQMALNEGKPVYVFDQLKNKWFEADYTSDMFGTKTFNNFIETTTPILTKNYAGIGTREINDSGKQAIKNVYEKTKQYLESNKGNVVTAEEMLKNFYNYFPSFTALSQTQRKLFINDIINGKLQITC